MSIIVGSENEYRFFLSVINQKPSLLTARCSGPNTEVVRLYLQIGIVHFLISVEAQ
jgi:hypothetical protein